MYELLADANVYSIYSSRLVHLLPNYITIGQIAMNFDTLAVFT